MELSFADLKEKEIINVVDGKKLGRIIDILFDTDNGFVRGIVVPGERKFFKKSEDIFIPLEKLKKIGDDVILVRLQFDSDRGFSGQARETILQNRRYSFDNSNSYYDKNKTSSSKKIYKNSLNYSQNEKYEVNNNIKGQSQSKYVQNAPSFVRFRPVDNIKYK